MLKQMPERRACGGRAAQSWGAPKGSGAPLSKLKLDAVAETVNALDPALSIITRNTKGSTENVPLLEAGAVYIAKPWTAKALIAHMAEVFDPAR